MSVPGSRFTLILSPLLLCALTLNASAAAKHQLAKPAVKPEQSAPAPVPAPPPPVLTPEQLPAVAPRVSYQNHQLTIMAENSTLGDILRAVRTQTGASIELPSNANARIVAHLGPGPSRDVLATLLNGTLFNYVLLGTVNDPAAVGKIILTQKPTGGDMSAGVNGQPNMMGQQNPDPPNTAGPLDEDSDSQTEVEQPPAEQGERQPAPAANEQPPNIRTPEQLLQELQRQQQLQQQQGNQPNVQPPEQK